MKPWKQTPTQEKLDRIKANWRPGMSARDIMVAIGAPSRNAVIGYYSRYREELSAYPLEGVGGVAIRLTLEEKHRRTIERNRRYQAKKSIAASAGKKTTGRPKAKLQVNSLAYRIARKPKPVIAKPVLVAPVTAGVSLMDNPQNGCKFCINEPEKGTAGHLFCGEVTEPGKSWCAYHETIVWGRGKAGETETVKSARRLAA
ncbi:MAG: GcrA family cell cycle regulator [Rhizobiaceae bacterium]